MTQEEFESMLDQICAELTQEANSKIFTTASQFEYRVREVLQEATSSDSSIEIDFKPHPQAFPDIAVGTFGVEVKFTLRAYS